MKIKDIEKECLTTVGISFEFSNREINSINNLLLKIEEVVANGIKENAEIVSIDLKSLNRVQWLLTQFVPYDYESDLFNSADHNYEHGIYVPR